MKRSISKVTHFFVPVNLCLELLRLCFCTIISFKPFNNVWPSYPRDPFMYHVITSELLNFYCHQLVVLHLRSGLEGHIYSFNLSLPSDYGLRIFCDLVFFRFSKWIKAQKILPEECKVYCKNILHFSAELYSRSELILSSQIRSVHCDDLRKKFRSKFMP